MSTRLVRALRELTPQEHKIVHLRDWFDETIKDDEWLAQLSKKGKWFVISADSRILRSPQNVEAWRESGLTLFVMHRAFAEHELIDQAISLLKWWRTIETLTTKGWREGPHQVLAYLLPANFSPSKIKTIARQRK